MKSSKPRTSATPPAPPVPPPDCPALALPAKPPAAITEPPLAPLPPRAPPVPACRTPPSLPELLLVGVSSLRPPHPALRRVTAKTDQQPIRRPRGGCRTACVGITIEASCTSVALNGRARYPRA